MVTFTHLIGPYAQVLAGKCVTVAGTISSAGGSDRFLNFDMRGFDLEATSCVRGCIDMT